MAIERSHPHHATRTVHEDEKGAGAGGHALRTARAGGVGHAGAAHRERVAAARAGHNIDGNTLVIWARLVPVGQGRVAAGGEPLNVARALDDCEEEREGVKRGEMKRRRKMSQE